MKQKIIIPDEVIINKIYFIRGKKVMLDNDLAVLYGVKTKRLKEQVKRNLKRFPSNFMFELTNEEHDSIRSQNATLKRGGHTKYLPYTFTEHGVLMLANVLKGGKAIQMSVRIIEIFVKLREMLLSHKDILLKLEQLENQVINNREDIKKIFLTLKQLLNPPQEPRNPIGFRLK